MRLRGLFVIALSVAVLMAAGPAQAGIALETVVREVSRRLPTSPWVASGHSAWR